MSKLRTFLSADGLPTEEYDIAEALRSPRVRQIRNFVLGPGQTSNIPQACLRWLQRHNLEQKSVIVPGRTPDEYLAAAIDVREPGVVPLYWTCAVYGREKDIFFHSGTGTLLFFVQERMRLDTMQLAARSADATAFVIAAIQATLKVPPNWRYVASHKSPQPLLAELLNANRDLDWVEASSNGAAAVMCADGVVDACVCTETARRANGLATIHAFGSPDMIFFGGLTEHGASIVRAAYATLQQERDAKFAHYHHMG